VANAGLAGRISAEIAKARCELSRCRVVGDVMLDVVVKPDIEIAPTSDTHSGCDTLAGGAAANVAEALLVRVITSVRRGVRGRPRGTTLRSDTSPRRVDVSLERVARDGVVVAVVTLRGQAP